MLSFFCNLQVPFVNTFLPFLQFLHFREKLNGNELACRLISKIYPLFLQSSPALGPGHVDCQWSENGSRRRRGGSQQAYSKQALKARALFLPLLNGFLALDPQFQRQYCFRQQLRSKGKTLHQSINGYCQMMSQYGCPWSVKENNTPRHMSSFQWFIFLRQLLTLSWGHNLLRVWLWETCVSGGGIASLY